MTIVRLFLFAEAATLSILVVLYLLSETYMHLFLEIVFGLPSSTDSVYGSYAQEVNPKTSTFHDIQSVTGDTLCLVLILRALYKQSVDPSSVDAALLAITIDHGGFALACLFQWGMMQPVVQGGALAATAFYLWLSGAAEGGLAKKNE